MSLGTNDAPNRLSITYACTEWNTAEGWYGMLIGLFGAYSLIPSTTCPCGTYACLHRRQSQTPGSWTLVSVTTKHISLQWAFNKHLSMVELPNATVQTGKTAPGDFLHLCQGLLLDHSGMEGVSSRIIFESSGLRKQGSRPFLGFWFLHGRY